jgi:putative ubiquitin-RnfH superfamily antitoxin RatB of RatAB toxin-antitoxin module
LVEEPLIARVQAGEFKAGDRVEVYRNLSAEIDFRKQTEDKS